MEMGFKVGMIWIMFFCWYLRLICAYRQKTDRGEVSALRSIKGSLIDPYGHLASWRRGDPCTSNWNGVMCYNRTLDDGYLHVKELYMLNKNLSGNLSPKLGRLSYVMILDFMWNNITGTIPKEISKITTLELLLLNGNQLTGSLPDELGNLSNLDRIQIDQNHISGPIPASFANLTKAKHFHMNNNSLTGQIPPELSQLTSLVHLLLDNNNLSGYLPPDLSGMAKLLILQLDNNNFSGSIIPSSYGNMFSLLKLSMRNCSIQGSIPDWSNMPNISYIDLSANQLNGSIPGGALSANITTIDLSANNLNGTIPSSFSALPRLQKLSLANNSLSGSIHSLIWLNRTLGSDEKLFLDFKNNSFTNINGNFLIPPNVTIRLHDNPLCLNNKLVLQHCASQEEKEDLEPNLKVTKILTDCPPDACPQNHEYAPETPLVRCFCVAPLFVGYRLKSPGFTDFLPYVDRFRNFLSTGLQLNVSQLEIDSVAWQKGPRLRMYLKIFPDDKVRLLSRSKVQWIRGMFSGWTIPDSKVFGPFELLNFTLTEPYRDVVVLPSSSGIKKGSLVGIIVGALAGTITLSIILALLVSRRYIRKRGTPSNRRTAKRISMRIVGVKDFTFSEMAMATNDFSNSNIVGEGGYGKVYRGVLANGMVVAIKRAQERSIQGENEFHTEIEILSRLHHRNLVSLIGYCDEKREQMLVYEFMPNGTLRDHLPGNTGKSKVPQNFSMRVRHALGSAKGILYLHKEADPPIFHRDIKSSNVLLDANFTAKVADFGLSRLAPNHVHEGNISTHVSTVVKGTPGYLDPQYFLTHQLTDKSDVYSLGVVFLELLTGRHPISHGKNIVREVSNAYGMGLIFNVVDEQMGSYPSECVEKFIKLALRCCQNETDNRPSMTDVVRELENIWDMIPSPVIFDITNESLFTDPEKVVVPPSPSSSSSYLFPNNYYSSEHVGSDLTSGVMPRG